MAFGVYVHLPYCTKKCPYCDFNSYGVGSRFPEGEYTEAVLRELGLYEESIRNLPITSIFFGGGTPSLFSEESVRKIINGILEAASPSDSPEVTLEANPETVNLEKLEGFRNAGVNRISVGVQSFSERKLKVLGRTNTPDVSLGVLNDIRKAGFDNFNLDLIFGVSFEALDEWRADLEKAVLCGTTHISAYCLTIEDGTEFGRLHSRGELPLPDEDRLSEMFTYTGDFLNRQGYGQYEISNFAKSGFECRHNLLYWRGDSYLGLGAGAHSHFSRNERLSAPAGKTPDPMSLQSADWGMRQANIKNPALYMKTVDEGKKPTAFTEILKREEALEDKVLMGLRLEEGVNLLNIEERFGMKPRSDKLGFLVENGFVKLSGDWLRLDEKGILLSNEIIMRVVDSLASWK